MAAQPVRTSKVRSIDSGRAAKGGRRSRKDILADFLRARTARVIAAIAIVIFAAWFLIFLFQPGPEYKLGDGESVPIGSPEFMRMLEALADAQFDRQSSVEVLANGETFYRAELEAIRSARRSINLEAYIFQRGLVAEEFVQALAERARAGVKINLVLDAVGSFSTRKQDLRPLLDAGGQVSWYHPLRWTTWLRFNNRTHRELLIVDGEIAFAGGAGFADHWLHAKKGRPRWRDTMFRFRGAAVNSFQGTFVENWVESSGVIMNGSEYFPGIQAEGSTPVMVVNSTPSQGNSTRARVLYQALLASARRRIYVTTPYFLPDRSLMETLIRARRDRGLDVKVLVPGKRSDHAMTRSSSRGLYGKLLEAGVEIYEYEPSMLHVKVLLVDDEWSLVGSTNFDNRSFGLNDEISVLARDPALSRRLTQDFEHDLAQSRRVTLAEWKSRPLWQRVFERAGWIISRHQ